MKINKLMIIPFRSVQMVWKCRWSQM